MATAAQEGMAFARSTKLGTPTPGDWLLGEWVGTREGTWGRWPATIRITSYDEATHAFRGDRYLEVPDAAKWSSVSSIMDLAINAVIDEKGTIVMTTDHSGGGWAGKSFTFNLKRMGDGRLSGKTSYGPPRSL